MIQFLVYKSKWQGSNAFFSDNIIYLNLKLIC